MLDIDSRGVIGTHKIGIIQQDIGLFYYDFN